MTANPAPAVEAGFSSPKREILLMLKRTPDSSLAEVAAHLRVSKVAALRHLTGLESDKLVERSYRSVGVGRPKVVFRLSGDSARLFPEGYTHMSICALEFIEQRLGHDAVIELLQQRSREIAEHQHRRFESLPLPDRVAELARVRDEGGYMAEVGTRKPRSIEMLEHNCPILAIAQRFPEACDVERRLFESLLRANVEVSHRVVANDPVCRFVVRPRADRS